MMPSTCTSCSPDASSCGRSSASTLCAGACRTAPAWCRCCSPSPCTPSSGWRSSSRTRCWAAARGPSPTSGPGPGSCGRRVTCWRPALPSPCSCSGRLVTSARRGALADRQLAAETSRQRGQGATRLVGRIDPLGDDRVETLLASGVEQESPVAVMHRRRAPRGPVQRQVVEQGAPRLPRLVEPGVAVEPEQVERHEGDRVVAGPATDRRIALELDAAGDAVAAAAGVDQHAVEYDLGVAELAAHAPYFGDQRPMSVPSAPLSTTIPPDEVADTRRPGHATSNAQPSSSGSGPGSGSMSAMRSGAGWRAGIFGRVHAMDHPVATRCVANRRVRPSRAFAVQHDDRLAVLPLLDVVRAGVPDLHVPGAVTAFGDVALEVEVLEGMVLGLDGEMVLLRMPRHAARQRPRHQHAVALEAQVPVQPGGRVLLDHEPLLVLFAERARRFGRGREVRLRW